MIVRLTGGLGNQMFQYAFGLSMALERNEKLYVDTFSYVRDRKRRYELGKLDVNVKKINIIKQLKYNLCIFMDVDKNKEIEYENIIFIKQEFKDEKEYYFGCWQNVAYFKGIKPQLKNMYTYQCQKEGLRKIANRMVQTDSVAIHVRHGDYEQLDRVYAILDIQYYMDAMEYIRNHIELPQYYIFSDDIIWCKDKFNGIHNLYFIQGNSTIEDYWLMLQCKHHVIANSTYSWWPAWLSCENEWSINIAPQYWFKDIDTNENMKRALLREFLVL